MNTSDLPVLIEELGGLIQILNSVGLPVFLFILFLTPVIVVCMILYLNHQSHLRTEKLIEVYRQDTQEVLQRCEERNESNLEVYRQDTQEILHKYAERDQKFAEFYNVLMNKVKEEHENSQNLQTLVINNTMAMEQLKCAVKSIAG